MKNFNTYNLQVYLTGRENPLRLKIDQHDLGFRDEDPERILRNIASRGVFIGATYYPPYAIQSITLLDTF